MNIGECQFEFVNIFEKFAPFVPTFGREIHIESMEIQ